MSDIDVLSPSTQELLRQIEALPVDWHGVGSVDMGALRAIARHAERIGPIRHSVETGSGKTTLLFSHLSQDHLVFALDEGGSITQARNSPLLQATNVTFVDGMTQVRLPQHRFENTVQLALIDGPHGYPFPDLEYFYLFPLIEPGGLLLLDDIKIPTIRRMFEIIAAEDTFRLVDIADENLAFFERTEAAAPGLTSEGWWKQGYNRAYYEEMLHPPPRQYAHPRLQAFYRGLSHRLPDRLKSLFPRALKDRIWNKAVR